MESALAPNGFAFVLNTSLPQRSLERSPYISMISSDLKHMRAKVEAVVAKYSTLLQGSSYLWNDNCKIYKCHRQAPWPSWYKQHTGCRNFLKMGFGLMQNWNWLHDLTKDCYLSVSAGHMVFKIPFQLKFSAMLSLLPLAKLANYYIFTSNYIINVYTLVL